MYVSAPVVGTHPAALCRLGSGHVWVSSCVVWAAFRGGLGGAARLSFRVYGPGPMADVPGPMAPDPWPIAQGLLENKWREPFTGKLVLDNGRREPFTWNFVQ